MTITRVVIATAITAEELMIDGFCDGCHRLLSYGEFETDVCWWCEPHKQPPDLEQHIEQTRKRARAKQNRGARRPPPLESADEADEDPE
jgi:hypothetical protein